ncbi:hypothetical protein ACFXP3_05250 [Streptomyces sp. NPDC059096]
MRELRTTARNLVVLTAPTLCAGGALSPGVPTCTAAAPARVG